MAFSFSTTDLERVAKALGVPLRMDGATARFELADQESGRRLVLEIHPDVKHPKAAPDAATGLVSVYGMNAFLQLHGVTGMITSDELGEVIFFARRGGVTSGLVVERGAGCSLYGNVDDALLESDFAQLPPEVMMSAVALSMTESLFGDLS